MDIKNQIGAEDKQLLGKLLIESQVLNQLLGERKMMFKNQADQVLKKVCKNPEMYNFHLNPSKDIWELELKPELQVKGIQTNGLVKSTIKN